MPERNLDVGLARPLGARSVIASLLLGTHPPRMPARRLVQWCALFGISGGAARVALSRMVDRGELRAVDGVYELAGRVRERQPAQDWSLRPRLGRWTGDWRTGVVTGAARTAAARAELRDAMRRMRFAPLREGVWTRPDNLPSAAAPADAWTVADHQCSWWSGRPDGDAAVLARRLFAPELWARRATALHRRIVAATHELDRVSDRALADGFVIGAATLAHVRADPLLPGELCPEQWPGASLRDAYGRYERAFSAAVREWFRRQ